MVALLQRVREAAVEVDGQTVGAIGAGLLVFLGVHESDTEEEGAWLARKCAHLRIFADADGRMNRSALDVQAEALVVPQFTLYGDASSSGNRPSYTAAARPEPAARLYEHFVERLREELGRPVPTGVFGAAMQVRLTNDGPVTLWVERLPDDVAS